MYRHHKIIIIAALGNHRELGYQNNLPWHLPADLRFFKKITTGHSLIMGRKLMTASSTASKNHYLIAIIMW